MTAPLRLTIEDTGVGVTIAGDPGKYRLWRAVDPNGTEFLLLGRSAIHSGQITPPRTIGQYVELTEDILGRTTGPDEVLDALRESGS